MTIVGVEIHPEGPQVLGFVAPYRSVIRVGAEDQDGYFIRFYCGDGCSNLLGAIVTPRARRVDWRG